MIALLLIRAVVMATAGAVVTLAQLNLPGGGFWEKQVFLQWASVLALAVFVIYDAIRSVNLAIQAARIREYDNDMRACLSAAISAVIDATGAPWDELSIRYYGLRGVLFWRRLELIAAVCAGANLVDSQRSFSPGVGVAGQAFVQQVNIAIEWSDFVRSATEAGPDAWAGRGERERYGLTWGQLRRSPQPDGLIASPTFALNGNPSGCIVVSGPLKVVDLAGDSVRRTLDELATVLDQLGSPPRGWWGSHGR
ncbi:hypothetical protein [Micromonospora sp. NPDC049203]|uniref:hypothetical protein n=1 Tax=Micromonospora sp. NPDC049203 TaxID=3364267 RepID=UPI00371F4245